MSVSCDHNHAPPDHNGPRPWLETPLRRAAIAPFTGPIRLYRLTLSPILGRQCRFQPTCSHYALDAYHTHGPFGGTRLTLWRLLRCQPFCRGGYDPVPPFEPRGPKAGEAASASSQG